ncbi:hypothetical protein ACOSQ2_006963 [Xanthoceras sorbifolium]
MTNAFGGLKLLVEANGEEIFEEENQQISSTTTAVDGRFLLRLSLLHVLLDQLPDSATACQTSASENISEGKGKSEKRARNWKLKHDVIKAVNELIEDLNTCHESIAEQAVELIHHKYQGHVLAKELSAKSLKTTVITDSAVFAIISRVNMVIINFDCFSA